MSTGAGSRITAKVVLCASTDCACVRPATTFLPHTANAFVEKVYNQLLICQLNAFDNY